MRCIVAKNNANNNLSMSFNFYLTGIPRNTFSAKSITASFFSACIQYYIIQ